MTVGWDKKKNPQSSPVLERQLEWLHDCSPDWWCLYAVRRESLNSGSWTCVSMGFLVLIQASDTGL